MNFKSMLAICLLLIITVFLGCTATQQRPVSEEPAFPEGVADARWGMQVKEVKGRWRHSRMTRGRRPSHSTPRESTSTSPIVSYFFTPNSKKLYRTDVTFGDPGVYGAVRGNLVHMFKNPTIAQPDTEVWTWRNSSMVILQKNPDSVQISFSSGPLLKLNNEEGGEPLSGPSGPWKGPVITYK